MSTEPARTARGSALAIGDVMLALGDSIAAGIGAAHISEGCMALVAERLTVLRPGVIHVNLAIPGETTHSMLRPGGQLDRALARVAAIAAEGRVVAPILLSIGGNDAMEARALGEDRSFSRLGHNLDVILGRLDAALGAVGCRLAGSACLQTVYNPFEVVAGWDGRSRAGVLAPRAVGGGYNRVIRAAAAAHGVEVADVAAAFRGRAAEMTWVRSGDIHPSGAGHAAIAETYMTACGWAAGG